MELNMDLNPQLTPEGVVEPDYRELSVSIIAQGCSIEGNVTVERGLSILGLVNGDVYSHSGLLHIGESGRVKGNIVGQDVLIAGRIEGDVHAHGVLTIDGQVRGNIRYTVVRLGEQADLDNCHMQRIRPGEVVASSTKSLGTSAQGHSGAPAMEQAPVQASGNLVETATVRQIPLPQNVA
jgi:hypothetical protein